jgi:hypothetical protein
MDGESPKHRPGESGAGGQNRLAADGASGDLTEGEVVLGTTLRSRYSLGLRSDKSLAEDFVGEPTGNYAAWGRAENYAACGRAATG